MEEKGQLLRLADHPEFRTDIQDPQEREPFEDIDWENEGVSLAVCTDCVHKQDCRPKWRQLLGAPATPADLRCTLKDGVRCDVVNAQNDCDDFEIAIYYR